MAKTISFKELFDFLSKSVDESIIDKPAMKSLGEAIAEIVRVRTRLGYGVRGNNEKREKLKPLSAIYVQYRKDNRASLSGLTRFKKSNLTFTGELLDSVKPLRVKEGEVRVGPSGVRSGGLKNIDLGTYVSQKGRPFLNLSDNELKQLSRILDEGLNKSLKRRLGY